MRVICEKSCLRGEANFSSRFSLSSISNRMDDTVIWHFSFFHRGLKEETGPSYSKLHPWRHKLFEEVMFPQAEYLPSTTVFVQFNTTLCRIPKDKSRYDGEKVKKTKNWKRKIPLLSTNQKTAFIYKVELLAISAVFILVFCIFCFSIFCKKNLKILKSSDQKS